jgi:hypothetical protein
MTAEGTVGALTCVSSKFELFTNNPKLHTLQREVCAFLCKSSVQRSFRLTLDKNNCFTTKSMGSA